MSKSRGLKLIIEFDRDLIGDVTENVAAFMVTGWQDIPPTGMPSLMTYPVESVKRTLGADNAIELIFTDSSRFSDVIGGLTVSYDAEVGTLTGGRPVESFSNTFNPTELIGTPIHRECLTGKVSPAVVLMTLSYIYVYQGDSVSHKVTGKIGDVTVILTEV